MPKENYTHLSFIVDRSTSMQSIKNEMQEGFNNLVIDQQDVEGDATVTVVTFDTDYELLHDMVSINDIPEFILQPRGWTALLDGMGYTMNLVRGQIMEMAPEDRPSRCIFVVITDGEENRSKEFTRDVVFEMVEDCQSDEEINFEFVFLGANMDSIREGGGLGFRAGASMDFCASSQGTRDMYTSLSKGLTSYRSKCSSDATFEFDKNKNDTIGALTPNVPDYLIDDNDTK